MSRGNGRMAIFLDDEDYRQFVHLLGDTCDRFAMECWSYCAMPNHYHAALWPDRPNLSDGIRHLNGEYGKWWNRKHGRFGHTFRGRFKAQIVQDDMYLLTLAIHCAAPGPGRLGRLPR